MKMRRQTRREFLQTTGALAITAIVPQLGCDSNEVDFRTMPTAPDMDLPADLPMNEMPGAPITSNRRFYLQSINGQNYDPKLSIGNWSLKIDGLVNDAISGLSYAEITAMPIQRQIMTMQCIGNWIGGPLVGNAEWGGTVFRDVLEMAGIRDEVTRVKFYSHDDYDLDSARASPARQRPADLGNERRAAALQARLPGAADQSRALRAEDAEVDNAHRADRRGLSGLLGEQTRRQNPKASPSSGRTTQWQPSTRE